MRLWRGEAGLGADGRGLGGVVAMMSAWRVEPLGRGVVASPSSRLAQECSGQRHPSSETRGKKRMFGREADCAEGRYPRRLRVGRTLEENKVWGLVLESREADPPVLRS